MRTKEGVTTAVIRVDYIDPISVALLKALQESANLLYPLEQRGGEGEAVLEGHSRLPRRFCHGKEGYSSSQILIERRFLH
ncbi:unnamed protein product [Nezara viridula]|uniref:Uncharacterized protein n=1 Tax=Nezara viridula TaxID=85310 RepID=A0A9P0EE01_NEZVI|nr:unnamed protein product [Nezara viridula]